MAVSLQNGKGNGVVQFVGSKTKDADVEDFIRINVCGMVYETLKSTLEKFPSTLLGNKIERDKYYVPYKNAYFFDRHRDCFEALLFFYQSGGTLLRPTQVPMDLFEREIKFFRIPMDHFKHLQKLEGYITVDETDTTRVLPEGEWQRKIWEIMEYSETIIGRVVVMITVVIITVSIITFCVESLPLFHNAMYKYDPKTTLLIIGTGNNTKINNTRFDPNAALALQVSSVLSNIELITIIWFTAEYVIRFLASPNKWKFFTSLLNLIDLAAILPYYITLFIVNSQHGSSLGVIRVARLVRVLRVFKLSRHFLGLQILGNTLKASLSEIVMLVFILFFFVLIFSSAMYYVEHEGNGEQFESIPGAFWYSLVTMTTVGYGDCVPKSPLGKTVGCMCTLCGVITLAMAVPVISTNFEFFYKRDQFENLQKGQECIQCDDEEFLEEDECDSKEKSKDNDSSVKDSMI